jgi:acetoin:2,6-dichlorophenolindophenol oxidoreductase subunit beta
MSMPNSDSNSKDFAGEIKSGLEQALKENSKLLLMGLGVNDPKGVFGTTTGLNRQFGSTRVLETPTSENAVTGIGVGLAITGHPVVMVHQRLDFFLLAMDQLVNSAAKWHYMYGGQSSVPITIRLITGRGWGQGPTHSQNLHSWFTHIPGLKVVMPSFAHEAKPLLLASIEDPNPVIFIEDRWCHVQKIDENLLRRAGKVKFGEAEIIKEGGDVTVVAAGFASVESLRAANYLEKIGIGVELVNLRTLKPLDTEKIYQSLKKTGKLLVVDSGSEIASFASEIVSLVSRNAFSFLKLAPQIISAPDVPEPTSHGVTEKFKFDALVIAQRIIQILNYDGTLNLSPLRNTPHDAPNKTFMGPF